MKVKPPFSDELDKWAARFIRIAHTAPRSLSHTTSPSHIMFSTNKHAAAAARRQSLEAERAHNLATALVAKQRIAEQRLQQQQQQQQQQKQQKRSTILTTFGRKAVSSSAAQRRSSVSTVSTNSTDCSCSAVSVCAYSDADAATSEPASAARYCSRSKSSKPASGVSSSSSTSSTDVCSPPIDASTDLVASLSQALPAFLLMRALVWMLCLKQPQPSAHKRACCYRPRHVRSHTPLVTVTSM
jgi:hypothetical protein